MMLSGKNKWGADNAEQQSFSPEGREDRGNKNLSLYWDMHSYAFGENDIMHVYRLVNN